MSHKITTKICLSIVAVAAVLLAGCGGEIRKHEFNIAYPPPPEEPRYYFERLIMSSLDIREITASDKLRAIATGSIGSSEGLAKPWGIAVHQGKVYVADTVQRAVLMFDVPGKEFKFIGTDGPGQLSKPIGLDVAKSGNLYVADNTARKVVAFDADGNFLNIYGNPNKLHRPSGVAISPDESKVYILDTGGVSTQDHQFHIYDTRTGDLIRTVGTRGTEDGNFNLPQQITAADDGTIYVTDGGNFRVQSFTPDGDFISKFGSIGRKSGQFSRPKGITTDREGNIYVVDSAFGNFQIFNKKEQLLLFIGERGEVNAPGKYMLPTGIDVDEDGRVYVADQFHRKVEVFRPASLAEDQGYLAGEHLKVPTK